MGKLTQQETSSTKTHFSHPHPLKITPYQKTINLTSSSCPACNLNPSGKKKKKKLNPSGTIYSCTACNFFLHEKCFEMPMKITHPFHKDHTFTLLQKPAYDEGLFSCNACGEPGNGFSYNCKPCGINLHVHCASMPLSMTRTCHVHELRLAFGLPNGDMSFYCDVCMGPGGSRHWLYRCGPCGFNAHLNCALGFQATVGNSSTRSAPPPPTQGFITQFVNNAAIGVLAGGPMSVPGYVANREVVLRMINMIKNNNEEALMQIISNSRNGGAGGGGGIPGLNGMGNGTGGQDFLQGLMGGSGGGGGVPWLSGGGGQDFLQAFAGGGGTPGLNGMGNGTGGQDFLQGIMGGSGGGGVVPGLSGLGGGGGGQDFLQAFTSGGGIPGLNGMGGGAGGQDFLQGLMGSGGGGGGVPGLSGGRGGQDFMQALMNGNSGGGLDIQSLLGGGNGLDFLGGALGGFGF